MSGSALRCIQIVASIEDGAAGPSYSVSRLSAELVNEGVALSLYTVRGWRDNTGKATDRESPQQYFPLKQDYVRVPGLRRLCCSGSLLDALRQRALETDIFHTHGLWLMPNVYPAWALRRGGAAFVISPRGMLGPQALRFSRLRKLAFWHLLQKSAVADAHCLHATSDQEYREIRAFGLSNPVAIIPNGIDIPKCFGDIRPPESQRVVLSLGRIHPKKGLDHLVEAWAHVERRFPDWRLEIVGPDEGGYTKKLKDLASERQLSRISFAAPLYNEAKLAALRNADLFILPSLNENFGLVVAEALAAGTPVIASKGTPWGELPTRNCGWWIDTGVDALSAALANAMAMPRHSLKKMGADGRAWMAQEFSWRRVAADMLQVYEWLAKRATMPPTVRLQ